jgi:SAM-dependent methyltransferase
MCPKCGSLKRDRRLYFILTSDYLKDNTKILDFSPSRCLYRKLKPNKHIEYISSAYAGNFFADKNEDITCINEPDNTFDLIICYHILEHIENDILAMSELYRILKRNGYCLIQTPFKEGDIYEDSSITSEKERIKHFGLSDHMRTYSVDGLHKRLESVGFTVNIQRYAKNDYYGFQEETILFCTKK